MFVRASKKILDVRVLTGRAAGQRVFIPRMKISPETRALPCKLSRRQFPVRLAWALTMNKAQGQTLLRAGLFLPTPAFAHGQLYVSASRVGSFDRLMVSGHETDVQGWESDANGQPAFVTENVVYEAILRELPSMAGNAFSAFAYAPMFMATIAGLGLPKTQVIDVDLDQASGFSDDSDEWE